MIFGSDLARRRFIFAWILIASPVTWITAPTSLAADSRYTKPNQARTNELQDASTDSDTSNSTEVTFSSSEPQRSEEEQKKIQTQFSEVLNALPVKASKMKTLLETSARIQYLTDAQYHHIYGLEGTSQAAADQELLTRLGAKAENFSAPHPVDSDVMISWIAFFKELSSALTALEKRVTEAENFHSYFIAATQALRERLKIATRGDYSKQLSRRLVALEQHAFERVLRLKGDQKSEINPIESDMSSIRSHRKALLAALKSLRTSRSDAAALRTEMSQAIAHAYLVQFYSMKLDADIARNPQFYNSRDEVIANASWILGTFLFNTAATVRIASQGLGSVTLSESVGLAAANLVSLIFIKYLPWTKKIQTKLLRNSADQTQAHAEHEFEEYLLELSCSAMLSQLHP